MKNLTLPLSLCTVLAVGIVYFVTDRLLLSIMILVIGLALALFLDKRLATSSAFDHINNFDAENKERILKELVRFKQFKECIDREHKGLMSDAVDNIYQVSDHILQQDGIDLKFIHQVGMYLPRINKILDTYLAKSADEIFKSQSQEFMIETSAVFTKLLTASGNRDMKEAESLMRALEETYMSHGHLKRNDGGI